MTILFRVVLFAISVLTFVLIVRKLMKSQFKTEDAFFWIVFSSILVIMSCFPKIGIVGAKIVGVQSPANFVFLTVIFLLIIRCFILTTRITVVEAKLINAIQEIVVRDNINENTKEEEQTKLLNYSVKDN